MSESNAWGEVGFSVLRSAARDAPRQPGVYLFLDERDDVIYVGKASNLPQRLRQHATTKRPTSHGDQKYDLVRRVVWEVTDDDRAAFWREADLIFALRPQSNANRDQRPRDLMRKAEHVPYIVVTEVDVGTVRFTLEPDIPSTGRAYGCFPHLGKGVGYPLGIACSDGYTAFLRLVWAASGGGAHMPTSITKSAPPAFTVPVATELRGALHRFLSGVRARFADELVQRASSRPAFMQPALRRDKEAALQFFAAGPKLVRTRRLRHHIRARVVNPETYRSLVNVEISPVVNGTRGNP